MSFVDRIENYDTVRMLTQKHIHILDSSHHAFFSLHMRFLIVWIEPFCVFQRPTKTTSIVSNVENFDWNCMEEVQIAPKSSGNVGFTTAWRNR